VKVTCKQAIRRRKFMKSQKGILAVVFFVVAGLLYTPCASAALPAYLELEDQGGNKIEGSCTVAGREGTIEVFSFGHNLVMPTDPASGLPTGVKRHSPLKILKEIDKSSPLLYRVLVMNQTMGRFILRFYRMGATGREEQYFTIQLENARITGITPSFPASFLIQNEPYGHMETVSFVYQRITWTWEEGGITSTDTWGISPD
jgi:type VI secretion system secreted protein Hcp